MTIATIRMNITRKSIGFMVGSFLVFFFFYMYVNMFISPFLNFDTTLSLGRSYKVSSWTAVKRESRFEILSIVDQKEQRDRESEEFA